MHQCISNFEVYVISPRESGFQSRCWCSRSGWEPLGCYTSYQPPNDTEAASPWTTLRVIRLWPMMGTLTWKLKLLGDAFLPHFCIVVRRTLWGYPALGSVSWSYKSPFKLIQKRGGDSLRIQRAWNTKIANRICQASWDPKCHQDQVFQPHRSSHLHLSLTGSALCSSTCLFSKHSCPSQSPQALSAPGSTTTISMYFVS